MALDEHLELSMMEPFEVQKAAQVAKVDRAADSQVSLQDYDELMLPRLITDLLAMPVVVGKKEGLIVAVYEVPESFAIEGNKVAFGKTKKVGGPFGKVSYNGSNSSFSVVDNGRPVAGSFLVRFGNLLEQLAFNVNASIIHRMQIYHHMVNLLNQTSYVQVSISGGMPFDVHIMERIYEPKHQDLQPGEAQVVNILHRIASHYVAGISHPLNKLFK